MKKQGRKSGERKQSGAEDTRAEGLPRRETIAVGLGALAALASEILAASASAQGASSELGKGAMMPPPGKSSASAGSYRAAVERALSDSSYAASLKSLAVAARGGDQRSATQLMSMFGLTPSSIKSMNGEIASMKGIQMSTALCVTIPITLTFLLSCYPRSWDVCSVASG